MYGRKRYQLVKDFASGEKGHPKPFNSKLFDETIKECDQNHHLIQSLIRHLSLYIYTLQTKSSDQLRLMMYRKMEQEGHNRADIVRDLAWRVGLELLDLPPEIQDKLTTLEKEYFKNHSVAIKSYMGKVGIELNVDMVPPKDPYIKIRVVGEIDQGIVISDKTTNFTRHSMHFLKRTDAEPYIARVTSFTCCPSPKTNKLIRPL
ncbi:hypothetical protein YC2023_078328 [Brassica napus]